MIPYVPRPDLDRAIADRIGSGTGVFTLEGPPGAGKSATLLHALEAEIERRGSSGLGGRGYVRLVQLWGDEPPSMFARRLVREAGHLHLASYPQPENLRLLVETMAQAVPGLSAAGRLLAALVPDDLRPLHEVATAALGEVGARAVQRVGPLVIGVDLLGGTVSEAASDFFERLAEALPPTVVLLVAQPGGAQSLVSPSAPGDGRLQVGAFTKEEADAYLRATLGPLGAVDEALIASGRLSLLPGDLAQLVQYHRVLGGERGDAASVLTAIAELLSRDVVARYAALYESTCARGDRESQAAVDLCAWVAVAARPDRPLEAADALRRLGRERDGGRGSSSAPATLWRLRQHELVRALCATSLPPGARVGEGAARGELLDSGWPLAPRHGHAQRGVLEALTRGGGLLDEYERRWLAELWPEGGLAGGVQAVLLLLDQAGRAGRAERAGRDGRAGQGARGAQAAAEVTPALLGPAALRALGKALTLLTELEVQLWRAGWHRTFAELYDALTPLCAAAGVAARDAAPALWFRRARARVQAVDWSLGAGAGGTEELVRALAELAELDGIGEDQVLAARTALGLPSAGDEVARLCRRLPRKAAQARAYARVLAVLRGLTPEVAAAERARALDEILPALAFFIAERETEDVAQSLTILADWYATGEDEAADRLAVDHYVQAVRTAEGMGPAQAPAFSLGVIHRSRARHERRRGRLAEAARHEEEARRWLLRDPDTRMGSLLASLL